MVYFPFTFKVFPRIYLLPEKSTCYGSKFPNYYIMYTLSSTNDIKDVTVFRNRKFWVCFIIEEAIWVKNYCHWKTTRLEGRGSRHNWYTTKNERFLTMVPGVSLTKDLITLQDLPFQTQNMDTLGVGGYRRCVNYSLYTRDKFTNNYKIKALLFRS